ELGSTSHDLRSEAFQCGAMAVVALHIHMRLVVEIRLDMTREVRATVVHHARDVDALLRAGGEQLVALEVTQSSRRLWLPERSLLENQDRDPFLALDQGIGNRRTTRTAADHHDIVAHLQAPSCVLVRQPRYSALSPSGDSWCLRHANSVAPSLR